MSACLSGKKALGLASCRRLHVWLVYAAGTNTTAPPRAAVLCSSWCRDSTQSWSSMARLSPALWHTRLPGASGVPVALADIAELCKSSGTITGCESANAVLSLCSQDGVLRSDVCVQSPQAIYRLATVARALVLAADYTLRMPRMPRLARLRPKSAKGRGTVPHPHSMGLSSEVTWRLE